MGLKYARHCSRKGSCEVKPNNHYGYHVGPFTVVHDYILVKLWINYACSPPPNEQICYIVSRIAELLSNVILGLLYIKWQEKKYIENLVWVIKSVLFTKHKHLFIAMCILFYKIVWKKWQLTFFCKSLFPFGGGYKTIDSRIHHLICLATWL